MNEPLFNRRQLEEHFLKFPHCAPECKTGVEFEKLGVHRNSGKAISYYGNPGLANLLKQLSEQFGWQTTQENGHVVGLARGETLITLEPGGQLELSTSELDCVHEIEMELKLHLEELKHVSSSAGIAWLGLGLQPVSTLSDIEWIPKSRYSIMAPHMDRHGRLSHEMMRKTASIHVCLDYYNEQDFVEKIHLALSLVPFTTAIFANSPIAEGKLTGFLSTRAHIWQNTDPLRCGMISEAFFAHPTFSSYVEYALDVPMLFLVRNAVWIDANNISFRQFMKEGYQGYRATMDDWELHLSSIFTEVRLRHYLEIRNSDCQRGELALAPAAFWKGIIYNQEARSAAQSLVQGISWKESIDLAVAVAKQGLRARFRDTTVGHIAAELLRIAHSTLAKASDSGKGQVEESHYLEPLMQLVIEDGICPADVIIKNWLGGWKKSVSKLIEYVSC